MFHCPCSFQSNRNSEKKYYAANLILFNDRGTVARAGVVEQFGALAVGTPGIEARIETKVSIEIVATVAYL
jgi:hypothetical protein